MERFVVTIAREYGSGGRIIGERLAKALNVPFYDKDIISLTARESGFAEATVEEAEHTKTKSFLYGLSMTTRELPVNDQVFIAQSQVIREISRKQACVIVGRCADYVLRDDEQCVRVFIHAPLQQRVRRVRDQYQVQETNPENHVLKQDKERTAYYEYFTQQKWGKAQNYHLSIDSSVGLDTSVHLIRELVLQRERQNND